MRAQMLEPRRSDCIAVVPDDHESGQLDDVRGFESMRIQQSDNIGEDLIRLLCHRCGRRSVEPHAELARDEQQFGTAGYPYRVAVEAKRRMDVCGI